MAQHQLATVAGVAQSTYGSWERGESSPGVVELAKLARYFEVSIDYLAGLTEYSHGLSPDSWIIDLDAFEAEKDEEAWAAKIPRRLRLVDYEGFEKLKAQLRSRGKRPRGGRGGGS